MFLSSDSYLWSQGSHYVELFVNITSVIWQHNNSVKNVAVCTKRLFLR